MPWYDGPALLDHLERVTVGNDTAARAFRLPVQLVARPDASFRGFAGLIASGSIAAGDPVRILPSGKTSSIARILVGDRDVASAQPASRSP